MSHGIFGFIPGKVNNGLVIFIYDLMGKCQRLFSSPQKRKREINRQNMDRHLPTIMVQDGYVEDQNPYIDLYYGKATMAYAGCEVFAVWNVLAAISGKEKSDSLPELMEWFEAHGMVGHGRFGTSPKAMGAFLQEKGFETVFVTDEDIFDAVIKGPKACILSYYQDGRDIRQPIHTVAITKDAAGLLGHNVYGNGKVFGPYTDISSFIKAIKGGKAKGLALLGVR